jgi:hypothetical protein
MKHLRTTLPCSIICLASIVSACSTPAPYVGTKNVSTPIAEGVQVSEQESRYILPSGKLGGRDSALIEARARVEKVEPASRRITIRSASGDLAVIKAGPEVRNFAQIAVGDDVTVEYFESIAFESRQPTAAELQAADKTLALAGRARLGEKPAAVAATTQVRVVTVESVDKDKAVVVLKDASGKLATVKAQYPENLQLVKSGDTIVITFSEAIAARVVPVTKK